MASELTSTQSQPRIERPTAPSSTSTSFSSSQQKPSSSSAATTTTTSPPKVDVTIDPTSHLDPGAYVRGTLPIKLGKNVLIHPRVYLLSIHSPLTIGDGCIIGEKVVLGGPAPNNSSSSSSSVSTSKPTTSTTKPSPSPTIISSNVHIHPSATIDSGARISSYAVIESNARVCSDVIVGSHSKVSAGVSVSANVPDWTVVWGSEGDLRRRSRRTVYRDGDGDGDGGGQEREWEIVEKERVKAMDREREGTMMVLSRVARKR